jgi:flagellar protein FliS
MTYGKRLGQYERTKVETAGKLDLVVMCYEKVIHFVNQAKLFYEEKQYAQKGEALQKAMNIINELQSSLDFEKGEAIAKNLDGIYSYTTKRLLIGDFNMDLSAFDEAIRIFAELKEAWETIAAENQGKQENVPAVNAMETPTLSSQVAA